MLILFIILYATGFVILLLYYYYIFNYIEKDDFSSCVNPIAYPGVFLLFVMYVLTGVMPRVTYLLYNVILLMAYFNLISWLLTIIILAVGLEGIV